MPTYEYRCQKCGEFELVQRITEDALKTCPTCGAPVERLVSAAAFHLKGSGWYKTDYGGSTAKSPASSSSEKAPDAASEKTSDNKPATESTAKESAPSGSKPAESTKSNVSTD